MLRGGALKSIIFLTYFCSILGFFPLFFYPPPPNFFSFVLNGDEGPKEASGLGPTPPGRFLGTPP